MTDDIAVELRGGTYSLGSAFVLTAADSGVNGHRVIYRAAPGETPVFSGGQSLSGWTVFDAGNNIYRAGVPSSFDTRQFYVNGVRATRARTDNPPGFTKITTGFSTSTSLAAWGNPSDIEIGDRNEWMSLRCGVASVSSTTITMDAVCWEKAQRHPIQIQAVEWIENAYELLDSEGEWYLDKAGDYLYYKPRPGENLATASTVAGSTESLLEITGTISNPVKNVTVQGITFAYTSWLRPNGTDGYPDLQAGFQYYLPSPSPAQEALDLYKTPAAVTVTAGHSIVFERDTFTHLGAAGINFEAGTKDSIIRGNVFSDISSSGIQVGHMNDSHPADTRSVVSDNVVSNNFIERIGREFEDGVGVFVGYTDSTSVVHNELIDLPYTGITMGWGWGCVDDSSPCGGFSGPSAAKDNEIAYNRIENVMGVLKDGGAIYTLGSQPGTVVHDNYVRNVQNTWGALYPDEASAYITWEDNVVAQASSRWLHIWTSTIHDLVVQNNYTDSTQKTMAGTNIAYVNNQEGLTSWPTAAQAIIDASGLESAYSDVRPVRDTNLALSASASASSVYSTSYPAGRANDDSTTGGWSPLGTEADARPWVQFDLGGQYNLSKIEFVSRQDIDWSETRRNFEVRASNSPTFATYEVLGSRGPTEFAHQATWTANVVPTASYRYVRLVKTADEYLFVAELRVFGTEAPPTDPVNFALSSSASASSTYDSTHTATQAIDDSIASGWSPLSVEEDARPWLRLDLGAARVVEQIQFVSRHDIDWDVTRRDFEVQASNDATFATYDVIGSQNSTPFAHQGTWSATVTSTTAYRYIRIIKTVDGYFYIAELRVIG
ncbi:discoidin domain-containing protein [Microbacterium sp. NPDC090218]